MGIYVNPDNIDFQRAINSQIYVDKSGLIELTNAKLFTEQQFICVSRPRRFGKSMAANMLTAYYSRGCDSRKMFSELKIAKSADFEKHLNKYNVIHINMVDFLDRSKTMDEMLDYLRRRLLHELKKGFSDVDCFDWDNLQSVLGEIYTDKRIAFISLQAPKGEEGMYLGFSHLHSFLSSIFGFGIAGVLLTKYCPDPVLFETREAWEAASVNAHYIWYYFAVIGLVAAIALFVFAKTTEFIDKKKKA